MHEPRVITLSSGGASACILSKEDWEFKITLDYTHTHSLFFVAVLILQVKFSSLSTELFNLEVTVS